MLPSTAVLDGGLRLKAGQTLVGGGPSVLGLGDADAAPTLVNTGERLHGEGDHSLCARVDCEVLREQPAAGVGQDGAQL